MRAAIIKYKPVFLYGISLALLLFVLHWLEFRLLVISNAAEVYVGAIALLFTGLGIWLALKLVTPKKETIVVEKEVFRNVVDFEPNTIEIMRLGISPRELQVLSLMAEGQSNAEIATSLFVTLNTIKTHSSRLFEKLEVNRRTQAVEKAKKSGIIA